MSVTLLDYREDFTEDEKREWAQGLMETMKPGLDAMEKSLRNALPAFVETVLNPLAKWIEENPEAAQSVIDGKEKIKVVL